MLKNELENHLFLAGWVLSAPGIFEKTVSWTSKQNTVENSIRLRFKIKDAEVFFERRRTHRDQLRSNWQYVISGSIFNVRKMPSSKLVIQGQVLQGTRLLSEDKKQRVSEASWVNEPR